MDTKEYCNPIPIPYETPFFHAIDPFFEWNMQCLDIWGKKLKTIFYVILYFNIFCFACRLVKFLPKSK